MEGKGQLKCMGVGFYFGACFRLKDTQKIGACLFKRGIRL